MYEVMRYWETAEVDGTGSPAARDYARIWRSAEKVVYSRTLGSVSSARTRVKRAFDAGALRREKDRARSDLSEGGPGLASLALGAGVVDEVSLFLVPIVIGGGTRALPDNVRLELELMDERRFGGGMVYLHYRVSGDNAAQQALRG